jgi:hypothetical protein
MRINTEKDQMVLLPEAMKLKIKKMGYEETARLLKLTSGYMRHLASKGKKRIRKTHLQKIEQE